jgi:CBS domain-containing protein
MGQEDTNLGLELVEEGQGASARIVVDWVRGYAAESGAPAITETCTSVAAFEREITRLHGELDALGEQARGHLGQAKPAAAATPAPAPAKGEAGTPKTAQRIATDLLVRDVMSENVRVVGPNDPLAVADELMKQGRFRHTVVVEDGELLGVLSQRDIFYGALAWSMGEGSRAHERTLGTMRVKEVMNKDVRTVDPAESLADAAARMREHKVGCLPVMAGRELVGILTEGDFLSLLAG